MLKNAKDRLTEAELDGEEYRDVARGAASEVLVDPRKLGPEAVAQKLVG